MESQEQTRILDVIERIKEDHLNFEYEHISHLKDSINANRSVELRIEDLKYCLEDIIDKSKNISSCEEVIQIILDTSSQLMKNILLKIVNVLESCDFGTFSANVEMNLTSNLSLCMNILDCLLAFLRYATDNSPLDIESVFNLPKSIATVLLDVFSHCKNSEALYSSYFHQIGGKVTSIFKRCHELQMQYFTIITNHIVFDLTRGHHMDILLQVLDIAIDIGKVVFTLDVKTMAEQWKGYSKICEKYSNWLEDKEVHIKATECLCNHIHDGLHSIINDNLDAKNVTRCLKSSNFMLKLVIKLCDMFGSAVARDPKHFIKLVSYIEHYSPPHLIHMGKNSSIADGINSHITVGAEPLLTSLVKYVPFRENYLLWIGKYSESERKLGDVLMNVCIIRILIQSPEDVRDDWLSNNNEQDNIVCITIQMIGISDSELLNDLKFDSNDQKGGSVCLYDHILCHCAGLSIACTDITNIEETLLSSLLQENLWQAMFSIDLWLIIARYSLPELRLEQLTYLIELYNDLCGSRLINETPQKHYLSHFIRNLFVLLPNKLKSQIVNLFPVTEYSHVWSAIGLDQLSSGYSAEEVILSANKIFNDAYTQSKIEESQFLNLLNCVILITTIPEDKLSSLPQSILKELLSNVCESWQRLILTEQLKNMASDKESTVQGSYWIDVYFVAICNLTANLLDKFVNEQLLMILQIISAFLQITQSCNKITTLDLLKSIAHLNINNDHLENQLICVIATLLQQLLQDTNNIVQIHSLEIFSYIATNTSNESIVRQTVKGNKWLKDKLTNYFLKKIDEKHQTEFKVEAVKFRHRCEIGAPVDVQSSGDFNFCDLDELFEDGCPNKRMKMEVLPDPTVQVDLNKILEDVNGLSLHKDKIKNCDDFKMQIKNICDVLSKLVE